MWWFLVSAALAHDDWLQAEPPALAEPGEVALNLALGEGFVIDELRPHAQARTLAFVRRGPDGEAVLQAEDGEIPAWQGALPVPGGHLFALERNPALIELDPTKFNAYLESEGLGKALAEPRARGRRRAARRTCAFSRPGFRWAPGPFWRPLPQWAMTWS